MKRTVLILAGLALVAVVVFLLQGRSPEQAGGEPKPPPQVRVARASIGAISEIAELTGTVEPYRLARLASPAEGPVARVHVREGDRVTAGDHVLVIGRKEGADALIASLREELKKEEDNLLRTRQLVESDALAAEQLDRARAERERVRALLVKAEETAGDYVLSAPWDGIVSRVMVKEGDYVAPRVLLVEIYDPSSLVVRAAAPERHATQVRNGIQVAVTLDANPGTPLQGRIARVYPYLEERTRTRTFEVELPASIELLPGMFARLRLPLETVADALIVPVDALAAGQGTQKMVFVVAAGRAQRRAVQTGIEHGDRVQILSGLVPGEEVIVVGPAQLKDGAPVRVVAPGAGAGTGTGADAGTGAGTGADAGAGATAESPAGIEPGPRGSVTDGGEGTR
jgi:RND family efflux transporter MFP subunit